MNKFALSAVVAAGIAVAAPFAFAQTAVPPGATAPTDTTQSQRARPLPGERIEARLAYARTALKITPVQEPQWNALANVLRRHATAMDQQVTQRRATDRDQPVSAIERLTRRQAMMTEAATRMNEVLEAAKPLYAVLNDDQKKEADALLSRGGPQRGHHRPRWH
jgi:periplasmic protein CpxP/Spy